MDVVVDAVAAAQAVAAAEGVAVVPGAARAADVAADAGAALAVAVMAAAEEVAEAIVPDVPLAELEYLIDAASSVIKLKFSMHHFPGSGNSEPFFIFSSIIIHHHFYRFIPPSPHPIPLAFFRKMWYNSIKGVFPVL